MVGEADPEARAHVDGCEQCRAHVEGLRAERSAMLNDEPAVAFLAKPEIAAAMEAGSVAKKAGSLRWLRWLVPVACVAAAALVFMWTTPSVAPNAPGQPDEILFKGAEVSVEAVRQRALSDGTTQQSKHVKEVQVRPGDTLRIRLNLARRSQLSVAIIADGEGDWMSLVTEHWFEAGRQFVPGDAVSVGDGPTTGRIIVGSPEAVAAARRGDGEASVQWLHIRAEATP